MINILGLAGSGKSTQGKLLASRLDCPWISIGELLRAELEGDARNEMLAGKIINDDITLAVLAKDLSSKQADRLECVLDGCPRSLRQAEWIVSQVDSGSIKMTAIIHLKAHKEIAMGRLLNRGRADDTAEAIAQRFTDYQKTILPILGYLSSKGLPVIEIDADGEIEDVEQRVDKALKII